VDVERAVPEVARVLRPGGTLGLVWNVRDETVDWVARLGRAMHPGTEHDVFSSDPPVGPPFAPIERRDFRWTHTIDRATLLDLVASRSYFIVLPPDERAAMLAAVTELLDTHPELAGRDEVAVPYITRCSRTTVQ
jgi:SAM-dependent methyltransferase